MIRRDYILRIIEEFVGVIHRVFNLTSRGQYDAAHAEIERSLHELIHFDSDAALRATEQELVARMQLLSVDEDWRARCLVVATLLAAEGDIRRHGRDVDAAYPFHLRALHLALLGRSPDTHKAEQEDERSVQPDWPDDLLSVEYALSKLDDYVLPLETQLALLAHYQAAGDYAEAENLLFTWLDEQPGNAALLHRGIAFYQSLLEQSDSDLAMRGLPRAEVQEGLADLQARAA